MYKSLTVQIIINAVIEVDCGYDTNTIESRLQQTFGFERPHLVGAIPERFPHKLTVVYYNYVLMYTE